jgi:hypothetical protein
LPRKSSLRSAKVRLLRTYGTLWGVIGAPMPAAPPVFVLAQQAHTDMCSPCAGDNLPP